MKRWLLLILGAWALFGVTWWVFGRLLMTEEKRVIRQIDLMRRCIETGRLLTLQDCIAPDYRDDEWDLDRRSLIAAVAALRREYSNLDLRIERVFVRVKGDTAEAELRGSATGTRTGELRKEIEAGEYLFVFRKLDKVWKLSRVTKKK
ncbi:MAG: nuclear transport factor 2 family protein [Verrucomicrobiae bacterium]|nr:nuclear transport factor 2 family protein [Verrucomicrobiae bacterium]